MAPDESNTSEAKVNELKQQRRNKKGQLTRALKNCSALIEREKKDIDLIQQQLKKAEEHFSKIEAIHETIVSQLEAEDQFEEAEEWMAGVEDNYWEVMPKIRDVVNSILHPSESASGILADAGESLLMETQMDQPAGVVSQPRLSTGGDLPSTASQRSVLDGLLHVQPDQPAGEASQAAPHDGGDRSNAVGQRSSADGIQPGLSDQPAGDTSPFSTGKESEFRPNSVDWRSWSDGFLRDHTGQARPDGRTTADIHGKSGEMLRAAGAAQDRIDSQELKGPDLDGTTKIFQSLKLALELPKVELPYFYGDPGEYFTFINSFHVLISSKLQCEYTKLQHLIKFCKGKAYNAINACEFEGERGFAKALEILRVQFGQSHMILEAMTSKLEKRKSVENSEELWELIGDLKKCQITLSKLGYQNDLNCSNTLLMVQNVLPIHLQTKWSSESHEVLSKSGRITLQNLINFLEKQASVKSTMFGRQLEANLEKQRAKRNTDQKRSGAKTKFDTSASFHSTSGDDQRNVCPCCNIGNHKLWRCPSFLGMRVDERWECAANNKLCFKCLGAHLSFQCNRNMRCNIDRCSKDHNRLLHKVTEGEREGEHRDSGSGGNARSCPKNETDCLGKGSNVNRSKPTFHANGNGSHAKQEISFRTVPILVYGPGNKVVEANAFLDDGSDQTYINEDLVFELGLEGEHEEASASLLNGRTEKFRSFPVNVKISSLSNTVRKYDIEALTIGQVCGSLEPVDWCRVAKDWIHLRDIEFPKPSARNGNKVDVLIGLDHVALHESIQEIKGRVGEPIARLTPLGFTCVGPVAPNRRVQAFHTRSASTFHCQMDREVNETFKKFWEIDNSGLSSKVHYYTQEEEEAVKVVSESLVKCDTSERYQAQIPWKETEKTKLMTNNYESAKRRLEGLERKLQKNESLSQAYSDVISGYIDKNYIRKVESGEPKPSEEWFVPHFPVIKMDRETTKVRVVFDASAKDNGVSLNDLVNNGPKLQNDLHDVLLRFRRDRVAVVCDVSEMYLQVEVHEADRSMFRFLWRQLGTQEEPEIYEFTRLMFGLNVAPFIAQKVSQENAKRNKEQFPLAAETILHSTYMDDSMDSVSNDDEAIMLYEELTKLWSKAGMCARKWVSNSKKVLEAIPQEHRAEGKKITESEWPSVKALGLTWEAERDVFVFKGPNTPVGKMTKRNVLSQIASLFDPLGFLSPVVVWGKILLQEIWSSGVQWDEELSPELASKVEMWLRDLQNLGQVVVPRCIQFQEGETSIHVFTDASKDAYAAVVYARSETSCGVSIRLIASKTRVAPLKALSISKLELMGAMLGLRLAESVSSVLSHDLGDVVFWVDSHNVLYWVRGRGKMFKPFIANRVGEIQQLTSPSQWRHVPGKDNPADLASRGVSVMKMVEDDKWQNGPKFLSKDSSQWPENKVSEVVGSDQRRAVVSMVTKHVCVPVENDWGLRPERFDRFEKLLRVTGYVFRFINNCRCKSEERVRSKILDTDELQDAENYLLRAAQEEAFGQDIKDINRSGSVGSNSILRSMMPKMDDDGVLRMTGRLSLAETLPYDVKFPIILPRKHALTKLIVRKYHTDANHVAGTNHILSKLSAKYWVIHGREAVRECETNCNKCKLRKAKVGEQVMAPLPKKRVTESLRAFSKVAVDYAGPFLTIQGRGRVRVKRYLCLFTCLSTRAVHLELAYGLDTDTFLNAFFRFVSRRGEPDEVFSDNGSNFIGASRELKELFKSIDKTKVQEVTAGQMKWHFLPPLSPHFGGVHEALIKSSKRAIQAILGKAEVTDEELHSAFVGAENILNSRPLTYMSASPKDLAPLTPNHFLHGSLGGLFAPVEVVDGTRYNPRKRWRRVQELMRHFWQRWLKEWLPSLQQRKKWCKERVDLKPDDMVLVLEKDVIRSQWPLGRVVEVYPGPDGHVRVAKIKTSKGEIVRNITRVCPLELSEY